MSIALDNPIFQDEDKAREYLEAQRWPDGPVCPHCGGTDEHVRAIRGARSRPSKAHPEGKERKGLYQCNACRQQFTVTVKTVFERSKVPLNKWVMATYLMASSKKGYSAHQLHRTLGVTYKTAWFMFHRIREFDFRYNRRTKLGWTDEMRFVDLLKSVSGKRLTYRRTGEAALA